MSVYYGTIVNNSVKFKESDEREWNLFTLANQNRKVWIEIGFETRQRTPKQNNALWLGLTQLAETLNNAGLDMRKLLKSSVDIPWSKDTVHDYLFVPIMETQKKKRSTKELTKDEVSEVWDVLMRYLGEKYQVEFLPFPNQLTKK